MFFNHLDPRIIMTRNVCNGANTTLNLGNGDDTFDGGSGGGKTSHERAFNPDAKNKSIIRMIPFSLGT